MSSTAARPRGFVTRFRAARKVPDQDCDLGHCAKQVSHLAQNLAQKITKWKKLQ
jgi:hypothetical protein